MRQANFIESWSFKSVEFLQFGVWPDLPNNLRKHANSKSKNVIYFISRYRVLTFPNILPYNR